MPQTRTHSGPSIFSTGKGVLRLSKAGGKVRYSVIPNQPGSFFSSRDQGSRNSITWDIGPHMDLVG